MGAYERQEEKRMNDEVGNAEIGSQGVEALVGEVVREEEERRGNGDNGRNDGDDRNDGGDDVEGDDLARDDVDSDEVTRGISLVKKPIPPKNIERTVAVMDT